MPFNIPILLTWARIVLIPLFVGVFYLSPKLLNAHEQALAATLIFIVAAITDWLDGWLARKLGQTSAFGAFLDPVADKLMVAAALIVLVQIERVDAIIAIIIIGRELAISALREWMAKIGAAESVAVSMLGKIKTAVQMAAIPLLLYREDLFGLPIMLIGQVLIIIAAALTLWSMVYYLKMAWPEISLRSRSR
ncbi:MAG: CDP-diacylglycerol--glycerol-3-phosphate 3-phosphatidyltransferase [Sterolibacterium sp.]|nr:CDP-diacylglycerol--glycerol-3-phosphate 3-phosphatidyltransferase [Sterolibacterium sp.]